MVRLAWIACCAVLMLLVSAPALGSSSEEPVARAAKSAIPPGAFKKLTEMNQRLQEAIDRDLTGDALTRELDAVESLKHLLVKQDFHGETIYGMSFASVFTRLEGIDVNIGAARGVTGETQRSRIRTAKQWKDNLEKAMTRAKGIPPAAFKKLTEMNQRLQKVLDQGLTGDALEQELDAVESLKHLLVKQDFHGETIYGMSFASVFTRLEGIDVNIGAARGVTGETQRSRIRTAKQWKDNLEKAMLAQLPCTETGTSGNDAIKGTKGGDVLCGKGGKDKIDGKGGPDIIKGGNGGDSLKGGNGGDILLGGKGNDKLSGGKGGDSLDGGPGKDKLNGGSGKDVIDGGKGKDVVNGGSGADACVTGKGDRRVRCGSGPACQAGYHTSGVQSITVRSGESKLLWFATPVPNFFYYRHAGFDSGGCDNVNDKLVANIAVSGSDGVVAYRYDEPPAGSDKLKSGKDCPVDFPPNGVSRTCHVFAPQLGFNAKDANDVKTYSVGVGVQNARGDGGSATASLRVALSWRPK